MNSEYNIQNAGLLYRPLTSADTDAYIALESYAFPTNPDRSGLGAEISRMRGLFDGDRLLAQLELLSLTVAVGTGSVGAVGIGSVASPPELRRRGYVAQLLGACCAELRAEGVPFCMLYPFKRTFYRRYGWADFFERRSYSGPPAAFAAFRPGLGAFAPAGPATIAELDAIYRAALRGRFGPVVRDRAWWERQVLFTWDRQRRHAYIWRDTQGEPRAYLVYEVKQRGADQVMQVREIVARDPEARGQLFAFIAGHADQVALVEFSAPTDAPVNLLFPEPLACSVGPHLMLRVLDVGAAVTALGYPRTLRGHCTIAITDDTIAANEGTYRVEFADGAAAVLRRPDDTPADLRCDIRVLAPLLSRHLRSRTAAAFGALGVASRPALDLIETALAGLAPFCSEFF